MNRQSEHGGAGAPDPAFVRDTYDTLLKRLPEGYSAHRWEETPVSRFHYSQSRRALLRALGYLPPRLGRVLEVGGGDGAWTPFFAARAETVDFLDISEAMLAQARSALARFPQIRYLHEDFLAWDPERGAYDAAFSFRNLEYMPDKRAALGRFSAALRPGGMLILSTKSPEYDWSGYYASKPLHGGQISASSLSALMRESGLEVLAVYPAILGKKTRFAAMRLLWHALHAATLRLPPALVPVSALKYVSESFILVARKP